jgi:ParB-like chromosome segregation protein Spo0J
MQRYQMVALKDIIPYENNPRINENAIDKVAESIKEFGFQNPIILDRDNVIVAGHTRLKAAEKLHIIEAPCIYADELSPEQVRAYRLADNKTSEFAVWDNELLAGELSSIAIDMSAFGFDMEEALFEPASQDEQGKLDIKEPEEIKCPHCGLYFEYVKS